MTVAAAPSPAGSLATFDGFAAALAGWLALDPAGWRPEDRLADRLVWDSLAVVEVLVWFEAQGIDLPDELVGELGTLGDLHHQATAPGPRQGGGAVGRRGPVLAPVTPADTAPLFALLTRGEHLTRYRLRGVTPSPEAFHRQLWDRVLAQFAVRHDDGRLIGLVSAYEADLRNRHVHIAAVADPDVHGTGLVAEATLAFLDYLFTTFDLRKVYAEALSGNLERFASGIGRRFEVEGRLRAHEFVDGRYEDLVVLALTREAWAARARGPEAAADGEPKADRGCRPSE